MPSKLFFRTRFFNASSATNCLSCSLSRLGFLDFIAAGLPIGIPCQSLLTRHQKLLAPFVVQVLVDAFSPAELCDSVFSPQSFDDDADLLLCRVLLRVLLRMFLTVVSADVFFSAILHSFCVLTVFWPKSIS